MRVVLDVIDGARYLLIAVGVWLGLEYESPWPFIACIGAKVAIGIIVHIARHCFLGKDMPAK